MDILPASDGVEVREGVPDGKAREQELGVKR